MEGNNLQLPGGAKVAQLTLDGDRHLFAAQAAADRGGDFDFEGYGCHQMRYERAMKAVHTLTRIRLEAPELWERIKEFARKK